jgi:AraC family transcriptional regulator
MPIAWHFDVFYTVGKIKRMKYDDRIQRSVDYIDQHLTEELDLEEIAGQSGYALSSFYRFFQVLTGFTLKEFVRNKRLAHAARELVYTRRRILDIALDCGFGSQEVFTRAFVSLYDLTPGQYRSTRKISLERLDQMHSFARQLEGSQDRIPLQIPIHADIIQRGPLHLVGMETTTSVTENLATGCLSAFWSQVFMPRVHEIPDRLANRFISYEVTDPQNDSLYHMACVEVSALADPPPGMIARSLVPGYYAVFTPPRPLDPYEYSTLVRYAYGEWFPMSGCEIRADFTLDMTMYHQARSGKSVEAQLTVLVPIHPPRRMVYTGKPSPYAGKKR